MNKIITYILLGLSFVGLINPIRVVIYIDSLNSSLDVFFNWFKIKFRGKLK